MERPVVAPPDVTNIPDALKALNQWVLWRFECRDNKWTKVPVDVRTRSRASTTDPSTWSRFDDAVAALGSDVDGLGFVFSPDDGMVGIDLDGCVGENGILVPEARSIVGRLNSYAELSPSLTGVKIWAEAEKPKSGRRTTGKGFKEVEVYGTGRFFTVTGKRWGSPVAVENRHAEFQAFFSEYFPHPVVAPARANVDDVEPLTDEQVLTHLFSAKNAAATERLWNGDVSEFDSNRSRADESLACRLAFYTRDPDQIRRLMEQSKLARDKWRRNGHDYLGATISKALTLVTEHWKPPKNQTDVGNGKRFAELHGGVVRYSHEARCWYCWKHTHWQRDLSGRVMRMAKLTAHAICNEIIASPDDKEQKALFKWAFKSEADARLQAMLHLAQSEGCIPVQLDQLDADPFLLNCQNGTIDLHTGELRPHDPKDLLTKVAPVTYDPDARSERLERFLDHCCRGDVEQMRFLQRAAGYSLTGDTREEKLFLIHGPTRAGKSTFVDMLLHLQGDYADVVEFSSFLRKANDRIRNDIAKLVGRRMVVANESAAGRKLDESLVKQLTGGDLITARFLNKEFFTFKPRFKIWLVANDAPKVSAEDDAIWRRILRVPFENSVPKGEEDRDLKRAFTSDPKEQSAILAWAVKGCADWLKNGLGVPKSIEGATEVYRRSNDPLNDFIQDTCEIGEGFEVTSKALYEAYEKWCRRNRDEPLKQRTVTSSLQVMYGTVSKQKKQNDGTNARTLFGIRLKEADAESSPPEPPEPQEKYG